MLHRSPCGVDLIAAKIAALAVGAALLASCAGATAPGKAASSMTQSGAEGGTQVSVSATASCVIYRETGIASWYGREFHGRKTAGNETFDMNGISAAHRTLPLGTMVRITNLDNYKSIKAKVNDRGSLARNRVIDLSYGAAKELGFVELGTAVVKIEPLAPVLDEDALYTVHVGSFLEKESALNLKDRLGRKYETIIIEPFETNVAAYYRVRVGAYTSEEKAERIAAKLTVEGVEPVVFRVDQ